MPNHDDPIARRIEDARHVLSRMLNASRPDPDKDGLSAVDVVPFRQFLSEPTFEVWVPARPSSPRPSKLVD